MHGLGYYPISRCSMGASWNGKNKHSLPPHILQYIIYGYPFHTLCVTGIQIYSQLYSDSDQHIQNSLHESILKYVSLSNHYKTTKKRNMNKTLNISRAQLLFKMARFCLSYLNHNSAFRAV